MVLLVWETEVTKLSGRMLEVESLSWTVPEEDKGDGAGGLRELRKLQLPLATSFCCPLLRPSDSARAPSAPL